MKGESTPPKKVATVGLRARFGAFEALRGVDLTVVESEVLAVIGPSGSGKSTLLRCINRMHETRAGATVAGRVTIDGEDIYAPGVDPVLVRRRVGIVFQRPNPLPDLSIRANVVAGYTLAGERHPREDEIIETTLRRVALWDEVKDRLARPGTSLSGGQQQRLCIARALALEPEILLMDEPCSALDPIATARIEELLNELRSRVTIIVVTHNLQQAARVADTTAFFRDGELVEHDRTSALFTNPKDIRTENYITGRFG
ncbi:MAG: phosphate ABC transporter ATP-binding protein [Polyangiaceae bacterium]